MDQLKRLLTSLTPRQRITLVIAAVAVAAGVLGFSRWSKERDFRPLYSNLAAEDAGAVVARLKETGIEYRLSESGSAILVPSAHVADLRLQMAAAGLPKTGRLGFELFDKTNFGATDFAEQVNYHRAVEGELERSVMAISEVEQARVHVTFPKDSVFLENREPAKASVLIKLRPGARLQPTSLPAITHLVASAVEGLAPEAVSVIDMRGNLLNRPRHSLSEAGEGGGDEMIEYRQRIERDLLAKIHGTLEPLVGGDRFRAGVSVECDFSSGEQSEEVLDPARSVMTQSQRTEDIAGTNAVGGIPGTASSLPRPASRSGTAGGGITRRTENISYQASRLVKRTRLPQGTVKRVSISVLLDQDIRWVGTGAKARRVIEPPSPAKIKAIRDVVAGATGLQPDRGDQLIVETLPFDATLHATPPEGEPGASQPGSGVWRLPLNLAIPLPILAGVGMGILLALAAGAFYLIRRRRKAKTVGVQMSKQLPRNAAGGAAAGGAAAGDAGRALAPRSEQPNELEAQMQARLAEQQAERARKELEALNSLKLPQVTTKKTEVLTKHIAAEAKKDPVAIAQLVRSWLTDRER